MGKENRTGAVSAHQRIFFAEVGIEAGYDRFLARVAKAKIAGRAIDFALAWTQGAASEPALSLLQFGAQKRLTMAVDVCWCE